MYFNCWTCYYYFCGPSLKCILCVVSWAWVRKTGRAATVYASTRSSVWNELEGLVGLVLVVLSKLCCFKITKWDSGALVFCARRGVCAAHCLQYSGSTCRETMVRLIATNYSAPEYFHIRHMLHMLKVLYIISNILCLIKITL